MIRLLLFFISTLFFNYEGYSQISFERTYGGVQDDHGYSIVQTLDSGFLIAANNRLPNYKLIKTNPYGDTLWTKNYPFTPRRIINTKDSNYVILSTTNDLTKINTNGDTLWNTNIRVIGTLYEIVEDKNGDFVAVGSAAVSNIPAYCCNPSITKVSKNGIQNTAFTPFLDCKSQSGCSLETISIDIEGNYVISASSYSSGSPPNPLFIKLDTAGTVIWNRKNTVLAVIMDLVQTPDTGFIAIAQDQTRNNDSTILIKLDKTGRNSWRRGLSSNWIGRFIEPADSGYLVAGFSNPTIQRRHTDILLVKIDSNYNLVWQRSYGGAQDDYVNDMIITNDRSVAIIGSTESFGNGLNDIYFIKTDSQGLITGTNEALSFISREIRMFPNPSSDEVCISSNIAIEYARIFDIKGRLIKSQKISDLCFNLPDENGLYFIQLESVKGELITKKIIKN